MTYRDLKNLLDTITPALLETELKIRRVGPQGQSDWMLPDGACINDSVRVLGEENELVFFYN